MAKILFITASPADEIIKLDLYKEYVPMMDAEGNPFGSSCFYCFCEVIYG